MNNVLDNSFYGYHNVFSILFYVSKIFIVIACFVTGQEYEQRLAAAVAWTLDGHLDAQNK